jgi:hypothetical protein
MSGGSYDYIHHNIITVANDIRRNKCDKRRVSFCKLLHLVSEALYRIDLVDSCDSGEGDEFEAIDNVFKFLKMDPDNRYKIDFYDELKTILEKDNA